MPYGPNETPERLKGKGIPANFIRQFKHTFNSVWKNTKSDTRAWKAAYSVMGKALRKAGYRKDKKGKWHKGEEVVSMGEMLLATNQKLHILEEKENGELHFEGVALVDNVLSENKRFYSAEFNNRCMEATNALVGSGASTVTIFSRHGKALGGFGTLPTGLPIGKVPTLFREGNEIRYRGIIVPTVEGKDMMTLVKSEVMLATSIRANKYETRERELDGETVNEMVSGVLAGIDFTDNPGIVGAGVRRILEEAPEWEEGQMDWDKVTLEELLENCKPLLDEHTAPIVEAGQVKATELESTVEELNATIVTLTEEKESAEAKAVEAVDAVAGIELKLKVAEAAHIGGISRIVFEELGKVVKTEEDIAENLASAKEKAMTLVLASADGGQAKGLAQVEEDGGEIKLSEEAKTILDRCV